MKTIPTPVIKVGAALLLAWSGFIHLDLYRHGYRAIPCIGVAFAIQASGSFAVAGLLLVSLVIGGSLVPQLAAAALAAGSLGAFILSRTAGIFGFVEHGLAPSPDALTSVLVEAAVLLLLAIPATTRPPRTQARRPPKHRRDHQHATGRSASTLTLRTYPVSDRQLS
ncbi:MAG: hypothetical protein ACQSGP_04105 [Frankia sp.]